MIGSDGIAGLYSYLSIWLEYSKHIRGWNEKFQVSNYRRIDYRYHINLAFCLSVRIILRPGFTFDIHLLIVTILI